MKNLAEDINITPEMEDRLMEEVTKYGTIGCNNDLLGHLKVKIAFNLDLRVEKIGNNVRINFVKENKNYLRKSKKLLI